MNKNMFKRAWLNIVRKPSKSVILFIIMFVMANLVLASLAISSAVEESTKYAMESIGGEVYLNVDMEKMRDEMSNGFSGGMGNMQGMDGSIDMESLLGMRPSTGLSMVNDIASSSYIVDYTYNVSVSGTANYIEYESDESYGRMMKSGGITGINSYAFIDEVENNIISITEGTYFDESTTNGVIISYEVALLNGFSVGDMISFTHSETEEVIEYEIVGIFTANSEGYENNVYMNIESATRLMSESQYNAGDFNVNNVVYYLSNPEDSELFIKESNSKYDFEEMSLSLDVDMAAYEQMAGPIESVGGFADSILIAVVIASVLIITLIINNSIKDRKYEMGVLMSLGAPKKNIIGQILIELAVVATIGFILSIGTSSFIAGGISDSLLEEQLTMNEETSENNFGRPSMGGMSRPGLTNNTSDVEVIEEINISISAYEYVILFVIGYLVLFISMIIPVVNIMKYEPKTILTGRE